MNTYSKYIPNVFLAKCTEEHSKNEEIVLTTKYGKENEVVIHNLIFQKDGFFFYSFTRSDGFDSQERAKQKAEKLQNAAINAENKSNEYYDRSNKDRDFLSLGEPVKVGHHSERRHRRIIEQAHNNMGKSVEMSEKAEKYEDRAKYWEAKASTINLSMPESLEYYKFQLEKAKARHEGLRDGIIKREHSFSLTYAKKEVNEIEKKIKFAVKLWGDVKIDQSAIPKTKNIKEYTQEKTTELLNELGAFFAFSTEQFNEQKKEGIKYASLGAGLICPKNNAQEFINRFNSLNDSAIKQDIEDNGAENIIKRELYNYECFYVCDISDAVKALKKYGFSKDQIQSVYEKEKENVEF
jgi:hypothetical protein